MSERADVVAESDADSGEGSDIDDPLRICLITKMYPPRTGGGATYAYELANALGELGHEVDVYTQAVSEEDESIETHPNVDVTRITKARPLVVFSTVYFSIACRLRIDFGEYDVIHGTLMPASTIAFGPWFLDDLDAPLVLTSHGTSLGEAQSVALETPVDYLFKFAFHPVNIVMDIFAGRQADAVVAISDHAKSELVKQYGFDKSRVHMIPHGVDIDRFYPRSEHHSAVDPDKISLLFVGRLDARKGLDLALRAFDRVDDPDLEFLIGGTGRHGDHLRNLVGELEISHQVQFLGYIPEDELPTLYSSADIFVLPSQYEGFGLVVLESMACGTPVIGVGTGGIPTAVGSGDGGMVVDRTEVDLADAIEEVTSESWRESAESAALDRARSMSWTTVGEHVEDIYTATLAKNKSTKTS